MANGPEIWIYCSDFQKSLDWYSHVLGFEARVVEPSSLAILTFHGQEITLALKIDPWPEKLGRLEQPYGRGLQLYFDCPNWAKLLQAVQHKGVALPRNPWSSDRDKIITEFFDLIDPDGYWLTFRGKRVPFEIN
jgi:lactoylglutathione lyase